MINIAIISKKIREHFNITQTELAEKIGADRKRIENIENGHLQKFKSNEVQALTEMGLNRLWLLTGEGEMFAGGEVAEAAGVNRISAPEAESLKYNFFTDVYASAGTGFINENEAYEAVIIDSKISRMIGLPQHVDIVRVYGDSMEPKYKSGDWLFIDKNACVFNKEGIYVILFEGVLMVKYLQKIPGGVRVHSLNHEYADIDYIFQKELHDNLVIVGLVKGAVTFN